uniref:Putative secreted protein n=1 Tax=Ixodes ricinus TaxID=34613 RepID=A0A6B0UPD3_IXORI
MTSSGLLLLLFFFGMWSFFYLASLQPMPRVDRLEKFYFWEAFAPVSEKFSLLRSMHSFEELHTKDISSLPFVSVFFLNVNPPKLSAHPSELQVSSEVRPSGRIHLLEFKVLHLRCKLFFSL